MRREEDGAHGQWESKKRKAGNGWWKWIRKERERMMMSKPTSSLVITMPRGWDW